MGMCLESLLRFASQNKMQVNSFNHSNSSCYLFSFLPTKLVYLLSPFLSFWVQIFLWTQWTTPCPRSEFKQKQNQLYFDVNQLRREL